MLKLGCIVENANGKRGQVVYVYWTASASAAFSYIRSVDVRMFESDMIKNYLPKAVKIVEPG